MRENTNKAIVVNSIILYSRLLITSICGLFSTRFALQALGVNDYGIFSVVGSVISFIAIINTIMVSTSNRFLSVAIGKGDVSDINQQFNVNLLIHIFIALGILLIAFPLGDWYILNFVNYEGSLDNVIKVFNITIIGSVISFVGVPYNGLLMARERFWVFCLPDIIFGIIRVFITYLLLFYFEDKLYVYTVANTLMAAAPTFIFILYCHHVFADLVKMRIVKDKAKYKSIFGFSIWVGYGALASVGKAQGAALIVNAFFNTAMNTALGLANAVNHLMLTFSQNISKSISPQITKSYSAGNLERSTYLACQSSKFSFLFMLIVSTPFLITPQSIFELWLGDVPDYVVTFTLLMIIDALIGTLNAGIPELVFATGKIKWYQIITNTIFLTSVVAAYFVLRAGAPAYALIITYIVFSMIVLVIRQIVLNKLTKIDNWVIIKKSYIPSLIVTSFYVPFILFHPLWHPIVLNLFAITYLLLLVFFIGLSGTERQKLIKLTTSFVKSRL